MSLLSRKNSTKYVLHLSTISNSLMLSDEGMMFDSKIDDFSHFSLIMSKSDLARIKDVIKTHVFPLVQEMIAKSVDSEEAKKVVEDRFYASWDIPSVNFHDLHNDVIRSAEKDSKDEFAKKVTENFVYWIEDIMCCFSPPSWVHVRPRDHVEDRRPITVEVSDSSTLNRPPLRPRLDDGSR